MWTGTNRQNALESTDDNFWSIDTNCGLPHLGIVLSPVRGKTKVSCINYFYCECLEKTQAISKKDMCTKSWT